MPLASCSNSLVHVAYFNLLRFFTYYKFITHVLPALSFFPTVVQPPVALVAAVVFAALVKLRVCRRAVRRYDVGAPTAIAISLPGMTSSDADRRRCDAIVMLFDKDFADIIKLLIFEGVKFLLVEFSKSCV